DSEIARLIFGRAMEASIRGGQRPPALTLRGHGGHLVGLGGGRPAERCRSKVSEWSQQPNRREVLQLLPLSCVRAWRLGQAIRYPAEGGPEASEIPGRLAGVTQECSAGRRTESRPFFGQGLIRPVRRTPMQQ